MRRGRRIAFTLLFLWVAVILLLGSSQGSMAQTSRFIRPLIEYFLPNVAPDTVVLIHTLVRKAAHFTEYFIFSLLAIRAFSFVRNRRVSGRRYLLAIAAGLFLAVADESLQSFNDSRTASVYDVMIDMVGAGLASVIYWLLASRHEKLDL